MEREKAVVFDVDGTLALRTGDRSPYDWHRVGEDEPNEAIVELLRIVARDGEHRIVVTSGRKEQCRRQTDVWFALHDIPIDAMFMRADHDNRPDYVVKEEMYRRHVEPRYDVAFVVDDRTQVVQAWRRMGLTCLQVAEGNF
ncbi:hypothetical protein [Micromonospora sp. NPDC005652]|uniref:phosphatase domain-containing protein n=1 Tax=Micromonospora sp. NPDC005652 TaxID=3157046 RepID=UPI0033CE6F07